MYQFWQIHLTINNNLNKSNFNQIQQEHSVTQWQEKAMSGLGSDKNLSFPEEEQTLVEMKTFARGEGKTWTSRASRIHHSFILWSHSERNWELPHTFISRKGSQINVDCEKDVSSITTDS